MGWEAERRCVGCGGAQGGPGEASANLDHFNKKDAEVRFPPAEPVPKARRFSRAGIEKAKQGLSDSTEESQTGRSEAEERAQKAGRLERRESLPAGERQEEEDRRESAVPNLRGSGDSRKAGTTTNAERGI